MYDNKDLEIIQPTLNPGTMDSEWKHIPIHHDESIFRSNELQQRVWVTGGKMPLRKKGQGKAIHVSDFITKEMGRLSLSEVQISYDNALPKDKRLEIHDSREIIYPGKNADGWWMGEMLIKQFFFDQSSAHGAFAKDALNSNEMNVKPGGNQRRMHATFIPDDNPNPVLRGQPQDMIFPDDLPPDHQYYDFCGQAKGMKAVLEERGLWDYLCTQNGGKALFGDCAKCKLSQKAHDALARSAAAQSLFDDAEDENTPPEDNQSPDQSPTCCMRLRALADGTFPTAKRLVPELLDACPTKVIRAFYHKMWRYMDAYRRGLNARQAEYAVKKYRSHRRVGAGIMADIAILNNPEAVEPRIVLFVPREEEHIPD
ncbi:hypothetical protein BJV78DRAFT_1155347 [Lactifluus subvellereus]|nr:hypothetical protein BJV78DRAFT_1155347 [Lactifluus subvellereus]